MRARGPEFVVASLALVVVLVACVAAPCEGGGGWKVQKQTEAQKLAYETLKDRAKEDSENATPALLAYLDSPEFRGNISTLPEEIKSLSSEELLKLLNDTLLLSSVTHGIFAEIGNIFNLDISLEEIISLNLTFIPNLWERFSIGELAPNYETDFVAAIENTAEVEVFLLPNFTSPLTAPPLNQSQNRVSYTALNIFQGAAGAQYFGNVQFVLRPEYYEDMLIVAPYDTGTYSFCCLIRDLFPTNSCRMATFENGTCHPIALGTVKHWNHLFFQSQSFWDIDVLGSLFRRLFGQPQPEAFLYDEGMYFEGDILGNLILPDAAQYVIGDFSTLFGKPAGLMVMNYCASQGLPLVWALGVPNTNQPKVVTNETVMAPMNQSLLDPTILSLNITAMPNVTASQSSVEWFQQAWQLVNTSLIENPAAQNSTAFWVEAWNKFWGNLEEVHLNQLRPGNCADVKHCFGVDDSGACYCRYPKDSFEDEAEIEESQPQVNLR